MESLKKPTAEGNQQAGFVNSDISKHNISTKIRKGSKIHAVLSALAEGRSLNRFDAARDLHDTCLNSTVSEIQNRLGVLIHREIERVPCVHGTKSIDVCKYRLLPNQIEKARKLLGATA